MITRLWAGSRRAGSDRARFQEHWRETHAAFGLNLPGLEAYVQNHVAQADGWGAPSPVFDGCSELDFEDVAAMQRAFASPAMGEADRDEREFADPARFAVVVAQRHTLVGHVADDTPSRVLSFLHANPRHGQADLVSTLRGDYAAIARRAEPVRHELLVAVEDSGEAQACDVVDSLWFESDDAAIKAFETFGAEFGAVLAGFAFGREIALVHPRRLR